MVKTRSQSRSESTQPSQLDGVSAEASSNTQKSSKKNQKTGKSAVGKYSGLKQPNSTYFFLKEGVLLFSEQSLQELDEYMRLTDQRSRERSSKRGLSPEYSKKIDKRIDVLSHGLFKKRRRRESAKHYGKRIDALISKADEEETKKTLEDIKRIGMSLRK